MTRWGKRTSYAGAKDGQTTVVYGARGRYWPIGGIALRASASAGAAALLGVMAGQSRVVAEPKLSVGGRVADHRLAVWRGLSGAGGGGRDRQALGGARERPDATPRDAG